MMTPKRKREVALVTVVVLAIATSFAYLVSQMFKAPRRIQEINTSIAPEAEAVQRSPELSRVYGRRLAVHQPGESSSSSTSTSDRAANYGVFVPDNDLVADSTSLSAFNNFNMAPPMTPSGPPRRNARDNDEDADGEEQSFSGWGWLFDDMEASRSGRETQTRPGDDQQALQDEEDRDMQQAMVRTSALGGDDVFFVPDASLRDASSAEVMRPVFADQTSPRDATERAGESSRAEAMNRDRMEASGLTETGDRPGESSSASTEFRDPFAGSGFTRESENIALLRPARAEDVFFRGRDNLPIPTRDSYLRGRESPGAAPSRAASALNISAENAPSATRSDWSISASSDRAFASPAGYGSAGSSIDASGASAFSSMPSSFSGGSSLSAPSPAIGGSSLGGAMNRATTPSTGMSGFGSSLDRTGPSALPW
jgi:hypothetical protein